jgi:hypothetical protein
MWEYGGNSRREAASKARERGWKLSKTKGWMCPGCVAEEAKERKP